MYKVMGKTDTYAVRSSNVSSGCTLPRMQNGRKAENSFSVSGSMMTGRSSVAFPSCLIFGEPMLNMVSKTELALWR
jgi:hypothetical protein